MFNRTILAAIKNKTAELAALEPRERKGELPEDFAVDCSIGIVTRERFSAFQEAHPDLRQRLYYRSDGMLFCYGLPRFVHEELPSWVVRTILMDLGRRGFPNNSCTDPASPTCTIGDSRKEPDRTFRPRPRDLTTKVMDLDGNPFPTLVVESSFTHESLEELSSFLNLWLSESTDVQMIIGARLFPLQKSREQKLIILSRKRGDQSFMEAELLLNVRNRMAARMDADDPSVIEIPA